MIHTVEDGKGFRKVYVDDVEIEGAFYADTMKGVVKYYEMPPRVHKYRKRAITRTIRGNVRVEEIK